MLCQNCGKREAVFHYTKNMNGTVNEQHLCQECAAHFNFAAWPGGEEDPMLDAVMSQLAGGWLVIPAIIAARSTEGAAEDIRKNGRSGKDVDPDRTDGQTGTAERIIPETVAARLKTRRELQLLYRQMKNASDAQEYERAAALRDKIRELENQGGSTPAEK